MTSPTQSHATIDRELLTAGIEPDDALRRARIVSAIRGTGAFFGQDQAVRLRAHFAAGYVGLAADEAIQASLLDGSWVTIVAKAPPPNPNEKSVDSHLRHVTEHNPYGWSKPEPVRYQDHDIPGAWNAFRQCNNLVIVDRRPGARDCRIRGCTRWEVLGRDGQPSVEFDAQVVATALAREQAPAQERAVYGEVAQ